MPGPYLPIFALLKKGKPRQGKPKRTLVWNMQEYYFHNPTWTGTDWAKWNLFAVSEGRDVIILG